MHVITNFARRLLPVVLLLPLSAYTQEMQNPLLWEPLYKQAADLDKAGNYPDAMIHYEQSLKIAEQSGDKTGIARNLIAIGVVQIKVGELDKAVRNIQQGRDLGEQLKDRLIIFSALIAMSDLDDRQSRFDKALQSARQALELAKELKDNQSLSEAYRFVGHCYYSQGQFKIALQNYRESLQYAELTQNPSTLTHSLLPVGVAILDTGDYDHGVPYLLSALKNAEEAGEKSILPEILSEVGIAYKEMGMYEESAEYYKRALQIVEEIGQKEAKARILNNLGVLYANEGRNGDALQHYRQSLEIAEDLKNLRGIALLLNNIGSVYRDEGRFEEALPYFEKSLKTREEIGDQWGIASAVQNIGAIHEKQKNYDKAVEAYQRSLKISEQIGNKSQVALTLCHLGDAFLKQGNFELAGKNYAQALSLAKEVHSKVFIGYSLTGLGKVSVQHEKFPEALQYFEQALNLGKEVTQPEMIWSAAYELAKISETQNRNTAALKFYSTAIHEIERVRARASSDEGKSRFLEEHLSIYEGLISLLYKLKQKHPQKNYDVQAFDYCEKAKARMFLDTLAEFQLGIRKGLNSAQRRKEKVIEQKISKFQSELWDASTKKSQKEKQNKLQEAERELDQFILELKLENPQYAHLKYPEPFKFSQIQKQLDKKTVLLEFFLGAKQSFVFAVTSTERKLQALSGRTQIEESIRKYLESIRVPPKASFGKDAANLHEEYVIQARLLFQQLLAPVEQHLKEKENLVLILDGILHYIPFGTLISDSDRSLIQDFRITYAPSATIWGSLQKIPEQNNAKELIAFADPVLSLPSGELQSMRFHNLVRLRYTKEEVEAISSLFSSDRKDVYLGEEATEDKFQSEKISQYKFVHFATHALIDEEVPRRSGIVLTPETNGHSDGVLQMHEIWNLNLNTRLVVLSACETGLGKLVSGEGMVSLMRGFFYAGTRSVVVSLWNVDDNSTAALMKDFYLHMQAGKAPAESLKQAKLDMIQNAKNGSTYAAYQEPYYWGAFILVGPGN